MDARTRRVIQVLGGLTILVGIYGAATGDPFSDYVMPLVIGATLVVLALGAGGRDRSAPDDGTDG